MTVEGGLAIQVIAASFSPDQLGGATQMGRDLVEGLGQRGHSVSVLTDRTASGPDVDRGARVERTLELQASPQRYRARDWFERRRRLRHNVEAVRRALRTTRPDVVLVHAMHNLSRVVPAEVEREMPGRVAYYFPDPWPLLTDPHTAFWRDPAARRSRRLAKRMAGRIALAALAARPEPRPRFRHWAAVSQALYEDLVRGGLPADGGGWIHNGIKVADFPAREPDDTRETVCLLYAGQLVEHKGVHVLIRALSRLDPTTRAAMRLTVVGVGNEAYEARLRGDVEASGLQEQVRFVGGVPRSKMPEILRAHDILVAPSLYDEPLARILQEALASGLAVVATAVGGIPEAVEHERTGFLVPRDDAGALATAVAALVRDPALRARLGAAGRERVLAHFDLRRTVEEIEALLRRAATAPAREASS